MAKKLFVFFLLMFALFFSYQAFAKEADECDVSIAGLKEKLAGLQKIRDEAAEGIIKSDKIIMKAQELNLLARAKGDAETGQTAEKALRWAQEAKNKHRQTQDQAGDKIKKIKSLLEIAENNNYKTLKQVCAHYHQQVDRDKGALKKFIHEAERLSKSQEEREKEIKDEIISLATEVPDIAGTYWEYLTYLQNSIYGKVLKDSRASAGTLKEYQEIESSLKKLSANYQETKEYAESLNYLSMSFKTSYVSYKISSKFLSDTQKMEENNEIAQKELGNLSVNLKRLKQAVKEAGGTELFIDTGVDLGIENLNKLLKVFNEKLAHSSYKLIPHLNALKTTSDLVYHFVKINYLDEEVNRDYKLTDDLFKQYDALKNQFDKDWKNLKECEEYCKSQ